MNRRASDRPHPWTLSRPVRGLLLVAACAALWLPACGAVVDRALARERAEAEALLCARTADEHTDASIAACFTDRGLAAPEDLN